MAQGIKAARRQQRRRGPGNSVGPTGEEQQVAVEVPDDERPGGPRFDPRVTMAELDAAD